MKRVVVVASGATEQEALPHLLRDLVNEGIELVRPVRIPPGHRDIRGAVVAQIIKAAWFGSFPKPDKFVVLKDVDGGDAATVAASLRDEIAATRVEQQVGVPILVVVACWHLEAWFFADPAGLRNYLGRDLGAVVVSDPDVIENPKQHLKHLAKLRLDLYSAAVAGEIARGLSPTALRRSRTFAEFERAVRNGPERFAGME